MNLKKQALKQKWSILVTKPILDVRLVLPVEKPRITPAENIIWAAEKLAGSPEPGKKKKSKKD